ncbi:hypothetical protein [Paracoccus sp. Ld10]|uniref:hypothetical protein n=1 Tax=Paracoccus sp. Ld10 TaxID=649158 RepID=UPI00386D1F94
MLRNVSLGIGTLTKPRFEATMIDLNKERPRVAIAIAPLLRVGAPLGSSVSIRR